MRAGSRTGRRLFVVAGPHLAWGALDEGVRVLDRHRVSPKAVGAGARRGVGETPQQPSSTEAVVELIRCEDGPRRLER